MKLWASLDACPSRREQVVVEILPDLSELLQADLNSHFFSLFVGDVLYAFHQPTSCLDNYIMAGTGTIQSPRRSYKPNSDCSHSLSASTITKYEAPGSGTDGRAGADEWIAK